MNKWSESVACSLLLALMTCAPAQAQVTDDAFDLAQGAMVVGCASGNCENVIGGMLGVVERGNYICPFGSAGASCTIDFETLAPVAITGIHFLANHDRDGTERRATDLLEIFADLDDNGDFLGPGENLVFKSIAIPYSTEPDNADAGPDGNRLDLTFILPVTASLWRLQVRYVTSEGPRIVEIDALTESLPCRDTLTARTGLRVAKEGTEGLLFTWDADAAGPEFHVNAIEAASLGVPLALHRAPTGVAAEACDALAPDSACSDADASAGPALLFYQVVSACGAGGLEEGPLD